MVGIRLEGGFMKVIIFLLLALFGVNAFAMTKWEVDFEQDPIVHVLSQPLPQPVYPQDYRTIPENFETQEQPDVTDSYYEAYDSSHHECVRMNDKLMRCPSGFRLNPDQMIAKEMGFDEQFGNCEKHLGNVIVCRRGKR